MLPTIHEDTILAMGRYSHAPYVIDLDIPMIESQCGYSNIDTVLAMGRYSHAPYVIDLDIPMIEISQCGYSNIHPCRDLSLVMLIWLGIGVMMVFVAPMAMH